MMSMYREEEIELQMINERLKSIYFTGPFVNMVGGKIYTIKADGHCLFRALSHQLSLYLPLEQPHIEVPTYETLRKQCEAAILSDKKKYVEFLCNPDGEPMTMDQVTQYALSIGRCNGMYFISIYNN
uniref:OTU domain-containing protein 6B n=1 Tax=Lygus hesperus TaxID=30085 RepID=A0A0A9W4K6_LYGHE